MALVSQKRNYTSLSAQLNIPSLMKEGTKARKLKNLKSHSHKSRNLVKHVVFAIKTDEMFLVDKLFSYRFHLNGSPSQQVHRQSAQRLTTAEETNECSEVVQEHVPYQDATGFPFTSDWLRG